MQVSAGRQAAHEVEEEGVVVLLAAGTQPAQEVIHVETLGRPQQLPAYIPGKAYAVSSSCEGLKVEHFGDRRGSIGAALPTCTSCARPRKVAGP